MRQRLISIRVSSALILVCACAFGTASSRVLADTPAPDDAAVVKAKADDAFDHSRFAEALVGYQLAFAKGRDARLHYNIAQALTVLERYPEALAEYQAFVAEAPAGTLNEAQQKRFFVLLDELKAKITRVQIDCAVAGARVLVRDKVIGVTPFLTPISMNAGRAKVEVLAEGYRPLLLDVDLVGGSTQTVLAVLERVDFTGTVTFAASLVGVQIFVDGSPRGVAPMSLRLERGTHTVVAKASGYLDVNKTLTINPGVKESVWLGMARAPDYTVAYVGFSVAAVGIATGTVTGILAFTRLDAAKANCDTDKNLCGPAAQDDLRGSKTWALLSNIGFGVGLAGVGFGIYGLASARRGEPAALSPVAAVTLTPGGILVRGIF